MVGRIQLLGLLAIIAVALSCGKTNDPTPAPPGPPISPGFKFAYPDSILFVKEQATDYIVNPSVAAAGTYSGFPEGIELDPKTGAINVSKSETGLRYRISFKPTTGTDSFSTMIVISGINFLDGFYRLNSADSIVRPLYNANKGSSIPGTGNGSNGSVFDEGSNCNSNGCRVNTTDDSINLAQTVRAGIFGNTPANNERKEFELDYRINDKSNKSINKLRVKLYYFNSLADVTPEVYDIISSREGTLLSAAPNTDPATARLNITGARVAKTAKPRPPCIFILAN